MFPQISRSAGKMVFKGGWPASDDKLIVLLYLREYVLIIYIYLNLQ